MSANHEHDHARRYARARRRFTFAWLALVLLLAASAGTARLHLGLGNLLAGVGIALVKAAIVAWVFMALREATALPRIAAAAGVAALLVMASLSLVDYAPRGDEPAAWQLPQQVPARLAQIHDTPGALPAPATSSPALQPPSRSKGDRP